MSRVVLPDENIPVPVLPRRRRQRSKLVFQPLELPPHHHDAPCNCELTIGYIRVSSTQGKDRIVSPDIQLDAIMLDARLNNRRVIKLVFDINKSGKTLKGRALKEVLDDLAAGEYRHISLWKWSRWGRNLRESLEMIDTVDKAGGLVDSATEAFDTTTPTGEFVRNLMLNIADWQAKVIGENWRGAHSQRRSDGLPHTGRDRFGYQYKDRRYTIDEAEAALVKDAYERYVAGTSLHQLTREWNARGLVTTMGGIWTPQAMGKMMDTGFAAGYIRERSKPGDRPANRIVNYDVWRVGTHEPIIDEELWQEYRAKREAQAQLPPRLRTAVHAVSGLMFCGECGRRTNTRYMGTKKTHHWVCSHRSAYHPDSNVSVSNKIALTVVHDWVRARAAAGDSRAADRLAQLAEDVHALDAAAPQTKSNVAHCMALLSQIAGKRDRTRELYLEGLDPHLTKAKYVKILDKLQDEEREARAELARVKAAEKKVSEASAAPACSTIDDLWDQLDPVDLHALLAEVIGMVLVSSRTSPRISESASRVRVVPVWEMSEWGDAWLADRRRWQASR